MEVPKMNFTQNIKISQITEETLIVGVDIGSTLHYARSFDWRGIETGKVYKFANSRDGFEMFSNWIKKQQEKTGKRAVLVGAEPTGHYWFSLGNYLEELGIPLVMVNPYHVNRSKELDDNSQTKSDMKDPKVIAKLVIAGRYSQPYIPKGVYAELRILTANRHRITQELINCKNRISRWFSIYFPEYEQAFGDYEAKSSIMILKVACTPEDIRKLGVEGINKVWREAKLRAVGEKRAKILIAAAETSVGQKEGLTAAKLELRLHLQDYESKKAQYDEIMEQLAVLCEEIPESKQMLVIKGIGLITVAGFLSEVGEIRRFDSPKQIQKLAGLSLRENSSGKHKGRTTISKRGRARLRGILFNAVIPLVAKNEEFRKIHEYYTTRQKNPLKKKQSIIAIGCKLIRIFYAILTKGIIFDSQKMMSDIRREAVAA